MPAGAEPGGRWLGADRTFVRAVSAWLSQEPRRLAPVRALLHEFVRVYPVYLPTFTALLSLLRRLLDGVTEGSTRGLARTARMCGRLRLLDDDGPLLLAARVLGHPPEDLSIIGRRFAVGAVLPLSGFLEQGVSAWLRDSGPALVVPRAAEARLRPVLAFLGQPAPAAAPGLRRTSRVLAAAPSVLRFDNHRFRRMVAEVFLGPFAPPAPIAPPREKVRDQLVAFFVRFYGDPRLPSQRWDGVPEAVRDVLRRWLNSRDFHLFFALLERTAEPRHWQYRRPFWGAFLDHEPDLDVTFVLGRTAQRDLSHLGSSSAPPVRGASFSRGTGQVAQNHSVLVLRFPNGVTVAEWSHNGTCRMWAPGNDAAPVPYQERYSVAQLKGAVWNSKVDFEGRHDGSRLGRWQRVFADWLRAHLPSVPSEDRYFPSSVRNLS